MHLTSLCLAALATQLVSAAPHSGVPDGSSGGNSSDPAAIFKQLQANYTKNVLATLDGPQCNKTNIVVRRSWDDISKPERTSYINAVKCLQSLPSKTDPFIVPGARNRIDDFIYAHINQTNYMHQSGFFLPWHRVFVRQYELALQSECNYTGTQPYWDWATFADDQTKSALWDGSETSMGGNGQPVPHPNQSYPIPGLPVPLAIFRLAGTGGGCVTTGPFAQPTYTISLGPVSPLVPGYMTQPNNGTNDTYGIQYNPRCLKRDFLPSVSAANLSWPIVTWVMQQASIHSFRPALENYIHPSAHTFIGADAFDLFTSPSDPAFFFLHSQIDRLWTIWQGQNPAGRQLGLDGTHTFLNLPPSTNVTLNDTMILGEAGGYPTVRSAMSATEGQFCYMYA